MTIRPENTDQTKQTECWSKQLLVFFAAFKQKEKKKKEKSACLEASWRNGVNFTKIGKVPNGHPSYVMWSTKKIKK